MRLNIVKEIKQYQKKWLQHAQRRDRNRISKQALQYRPKGRRNIGRPKRDGGTNFILRIKEQETRLTLHVHDDDDDDDDMPLKLAPVSSAPRKI